MKNLGHILIAFLFFTFGIVQWNDPDPWLWIALYFFVGCSILLSIYTNHGFYLLCAGLLICVVALIGYIPSVVDWFKDGMPSLVGSMKAESYYIELVREFFGLLISLVALIFYFVKAKKQI